jgi:hypothetical protein
MKVKKKINRFVLLSSILKFSKFDTWLNLHRVVKHKMYFWQFKCFPFFYLEGVSLILGLQLEAIPQVAFVYIFLEVWLKDLAGTVELKEDCSVAYLDFTDAFQDLFSTQEKQNGHNFLLKLHFLQC